MAIGCRGAQHVRLASKNESSGSPVTPRIVLLIVADDLGLGDLGAYGQSRIATPRLDALAAEARVFDRAYATAPICAPSRCGIMTGLSSEECAVQGNGYPDAPLRSGDTTLGHLFSHAGYQTIAIGKWGLGGELRDGSVHQRFAWPDRMGFDQFYAVLSHDRAQGDLPRRVKREGMEGDLGEDVAELDEAFVQETLRVLRARTSSDKPLFVYLALTDPHRPFANEIDAQYANEEWPEIEKRYATSVTRLDRHVGQILDALEEHRNETLIVLASDNGPTSVDGHQVDFFASASNLRGEKRSLFEGGLRIPLMVRFPNHIEAGRSNNRVWLAGLFRSFERLLLHGGSDAIFGSASTFAEEDLRFSFAERLPAGADETRALRESGLLGEQKWMHSAEENSFDWLCTNLDRDPREEHYRICEASQAPDPGLPTQSVAQATLELRTEQRLLPAVNEARISFLPGPAVGETVSESRVWAAGTATGFGHVPLRLEADLIWNPSGESEPVFLVHSKTAMKADTFLDVGFLLRAGSYAEDGSSQLAWAFGTGRPNRPKPWTISSHLQLPRGRRVHLVSTYDPTSGCALFQVDDRRDVVCTRDQGHMLAESSPVLFGGLNEQGLPHALFQGVVHSLRMGVGLEPFQPREDVQLAANERSITLTNRSQVGRPRVRYTFSRTRGQTIDLVQEDLLWPEDSKEMSLRSLEPFDSLDIQSSIEGGGELLGSRYRLRRAPRVSGGCSLSASVASLAVSSRGALTLFGACGLWLAFWRRKCARPFRGRQRSQKN